MITKFLTIHCIASDYQIQTETATSEAVLHPRQESKDINAGPELSNVKLNVRLRQDLKNQIARGREERGRVGIERIFQYELLACSGWRCSGDRRIK